MDQRGAIATWERAEPTSLEKQWGELLAVVYHAVDDSGLIAFGQCQWTPKLPFHHLILKPKDDIDWVCIYKNSYSWDVARVAHKGEIMVALCAPVIVDGCAMVPVEGGIGASTLCARRLGR